MSASVRRRAAAVPKSEEIDRLKTQLRGRLSGRIRDLHIVVHDQGIVLGGRAPTYYVKQLAQHGVRDLLPPVRLENSIAVDSVGPGGPSEPMAACG